MCGIFGCVGKISEEDSYRCIKQIAHRGPDALVVESLENITLAHARLSILDVSNLANQPMADASGRYWIVYNGEVYNFLELRKELEELGYQFKTDGDTEVVLYAYIAWGTEFQNKCNGMWSIAIWDNLKKELFLSRDRFGVKPLYIYEQDHNFYFASEMKAFFPIMKERKINYHIFEERDYFKFEATENCCIRGIRKIQAGHYGYLRSGQLHLQRWWNTLEHLFKVPDRYEEQVEYLRELFLDACKIRMRSDVPIGTALSGGVDSSAIIGAMNHISKIGAKRINQNWQHAFVASMPGTTIDETQYAVMAAEHVGLDIQKVMVNASISGDKLFEYMYICEDPYITSPIPFLQTYGSIADHGIKVTIDGHGADELFGGYPPDFYYAGVDVADDAAALKEIWETYNDAMLDYKRVTYEQFTATVKDLSQGDDIEECGETKKLGTFNRRLFNQAHVITLPTLLRCYDRYSMGNGLEIRMPFMDYRIVSFAYSIPWRSKLNGGYGKKIVRDMAAPFMDKAVMYRKGKIGFNSPMTEWLMGDMKEFILDMVHSKDFYECELLNPLDVSIRVNEFYKNNKGTYSEGEAIWMLLVPFFWKKAMQL
ncbi:MAG: asparagine synthase (glutamine-hydrolyzing) [Lachnospiraceae bacterium]|nr:asparagine synthase (glutamine-hydrolyzing) [Lachnospiraceae bacterium]